MTGNKGEWSEIYVFLKLLASGRLDGADENLNPIVGVYYPIMEIIRKEGSTNRRYKINGSIKIIDGDTNSILLELPTAQFITQSELLLEELKSSSGSSFSIPVIENFLHSIFINALTATKIDKSDIKVIVHDFRTGNNPKLGFSIKSLLGQKSTLFNPGRTTNFVYKVENIVLNAHDVSMINNMNEEPKIKNRIAYLINRGARFVFHDVSSRNLKLNLQLIDSDLPEILGHLIFYKYSLSMNKLSELLDEINERNPKNFDQSLGHPFYEYKIKNFLVDSALGMTPSVCWEGLYDATGGIIVVKESGDLVCYHIYNRNEFQDYLLKNTKLEQASTNRYNFGELYEHNGNYFMKLNLQVRFY